MRQFFVVKDKNTTKLSELRYDIVTGDWTVISTIRGKRPDEFVKSNEIKTENHSGDCLFCDPAASGQEKDILIYATKEGDWSLRVFPNKFPPFAVPKDNAVDYKEEGPYFWMEATGYSEIIVSRDHERHIGQLESEAVAEILDAYQTRYLELMNKKNVRYIEIFHNHGKEAGASIPHPHSQLMSIPVVSPYIKSELDGAELYHKTNRDCVYCAMIEWEGGDGKRLIFENNNFIAFCPFASRAAFEIWVLPKKHKPYFERITDSEKAEAAEALQFAIGKIHEKLGNPDYNFYLHTSPCDGKDYPHYHWHIEILPRMAEWAGFEISTGIEISAIEPEAAAEYLRKEY